MSAQEKWDAAFHRFGQVSPLNHPDFIDVMERIYRCRHLRIVLTAQNGPLGIPAYRVATPFSGRKITSNPFNFYPPLLGEDDDMAALKALISAAEGMGSPWYVEYKSFTMLAAEQLDAFKLHSYIPSVVSHLELMGTYEEQEATYRSSLRQNLRTTRRHAQQERIIIEWAQSEKDLSKWYGLLVRLYRDKHRMICQPRPLYEALYRSGMGRLLAAKKNGKVIGGIFIVHSPREWHYSWAAYEADYARLGLNTLLVDEAIQKAIEAGAKRFDFGSSSPGDRDLLYFKSRWGAVERPIYYYYWNHVPRQVDLNRSFPLARAIFARMPLGVLRRIPSVMVPLLA